MRKLPLILAMLAALSASSGCSVYMAAAGDKEPNLTNVHRGSSRGEIEMALGQPKAISSEPDGHMNASYEYTINNEPSTGRAVGHAAMDVLTFGVWELFGTGIEVMNQGDVIAVNVHYDEQGVAQHIASSKR